ncbi:hypothetical protein Nepgr_031630 [Nepenthes gracilis]|uniref:PH domain-containing protein n=1 Tax=Nepenthes gracilis TaxID=150966 RepID=A0AAD3Y4Z7_NEPGR|nr:hypothetical protein Nepgr_031630 [Nepenthes gracilis]
MLEDQVAYLLQRYLGNYVRGLSKEALNISVWKGDVELTNMQLKPEALNALKLPIKVKAGFLGSVKLKVPWSRLGHDPVLVYLDRIFLLAESTTQVAGCSEDAVQEAKRNRIRDMEMKLLEKAEHLKTEVNKSWLGSLINTIIGNLKLSLSNIHIRYEDLESNPGHPFSAGVTLEKLSAVTVDDNGNETFATGGALDRIQKSVKLERLAVYLDSDISPWHVDKPWEDLLPFEWSQVFEFGINDSKAAGDIESKHIYILQPVSGSAKYIKLQPDVSAVSDQPLQSASVNLDDVTLCLPKDGYRDALKLADNFAAFNQRLKYAHFRPSVSVKSDPKSWWKYAYKAVSDQMKKASGKLSWDQVLRYAVLRKKYIALYASLLKSDPSRTAVDDNKEIEEIERELDIELIVQWRMVAHKLVEHSVKSDMRKQRAKKSWWSFGWSSQSVEDDGEALQLSEEDWERLNSMIGYKESNEVQLTNAKKDTVHSSFEVYMRHNASKLMDGLECLADLSCETLYCSARFYSEAKYFDMKLGSYRLSSPNGLLAESATAHDSLSGSFCYKPFNVAVDWSMVAKASPCYMTYLKDSVDKIVKFFENNTVVSNKIALETAAAVQMTIDGVKRTAQQQMNRALKDQSRFLLDLDIAAPKITIPTEFCPDNSRPTKLMLDLGNLMIHTKDDHVLDSTDEANLYLQFDLVLSDVSAFLVDGDYNWSIDPLTQSSASMLNGISFLPVVDKCGVFIKLQQIRLENPLYPSTRFAIRLPFLGFHFSPARYHRLMQVARIFQDESRNFEPSRLWNQADFEGWLSVLSWKGMANREAVWQRRYVCLVGPFLYILESPGSNSYKQYMSLRGKQVSLVPAERIGNEEHVLAVIDAGRSNSKVVEDANALILNCDSEELKRSWQSRIQSAIYHASGSAAITTLSETSSDAEDSVTEIIEHKDDIDVMSMEKIFLTGVLDELNICFDYNKQHDRSFMKMLLSEENPLFELRAIGGRVEIAIKGSDMFIGTVLKSLEIEDLVCGGSAQCRYLARSFIRGSDVPSVADTDTQSYECNDVTSEGGDNFYEASENLAEIVDYPVRSNSSLCSSLPSEVSSFKPPSFTRVPGLLPDCDSQSSTECVGQIDQLDSFVKAQIVFYDQNSPLYNNIDKWVMVALATLSFFCRRPMILAILEFANAINMEDESCESLSDSSSMTTPQQDISREAVSDRQQSPTVPEPIVKGLLGKGKSRVIFYLTLNMARAQILLMKENDTKLATLSQDNLLTDIRVFPSSFSIKASVGNLRISDDSLESNHIYFWACDMRNPGGSSFVKLVFCSYSAADDDYKGYDYSLFGQISEVRIVYLNRFVQEVVSYFTGLVPNTSKGVVKLRDQATNSEKWFTTSEIEGLPALKLDLSLTKPIILMPRRTDSLDYLKLDVVHITVQNTFLWFGGGKNEMNAIHLEILTVLVEDINLNVGTGSELGDSIIQEVNGVSIIIRRSLRDLFHQVPSTETTVEINVLKASLSNKEYQIITECAQSNISETPNIVSPLECDYITSSSSMVEPAVTQELANIGSETQTVEVWITMKVLVAINLVELSLHSGVARDTSLATIQVSNAWLLYKSTTVGEGFLSATLKSFNVLDDREGTLEEFRLAIGQPKCITYSIPRSVTNDETQKMVDIDFPNGIDINAAPTMLILDAKLSQLSTSVSLCVQRPQLLVALDFLLAVIEFFVPTVRGMLSSEEDVTSNHLSIAIILNRPTYTQPSSEFSLSPQQPLFADDERFNHFIYDGNGGTLFLKDRLGSNLSSPSEEALIYVGNGKRLQFKNVVIKDGRFLDSCIMLGTDSSYSVAEDDHVYLCKDEGSSPGPSSRSAEVRERQNVQVDRPVEYVIELQAISPELTFYNTSKNMGDSLTLSNKLLHAQLDTFCRIVLKGDTMEMDANALGLTMESNGIRILEPFDTSIKFSSVTGKTNIHISVSNVFMNFSFSILRLFLAVEEDMLSFLRTTSRKLTVICSEFDKVGIIQNPSGDQVYAFWRPRAPPGFAVLGDYLTALDKPPTKGVLAVNNNLVRVKRPVSFKLVWPPLTFGEISDSEDARELPKTVLNDGDASCTVWFPQAPKGFLALGCVVSSGRAQPPLSSSFCIHASAVSPCPLRDCIVIGSSNEYPSSVAFWRVNNSVGTFLPADLTSTKPLGGTYELRHILSGISEFSTKDSTNTEVHASSMGHYTMQSVTTNSRQHSETIASFRLVWWNQGSSLQKRLSIWCPVIPQGMVYFGDVAVQGYEPPNSCIALQDVGDDLLRAPLDFQMVGQVKKQRGMESISFWLPQAPPGFVSLGCIACKGSPKNSDFSSLRCIRSDMVTGDRFSEESIWDTSDARLRTEPFSIWTVDNELGTFLVHSGYKKPPKRLALKLADQSITAGPDDTVIDAEISTFSAALFDDFGGLMVPLFNISLSGIRFGLHGRPDNLNSNIKFSLVARSYNDKNEAWEPVVEPADGFLRYQNYPNLPGSASQLRLTSTRDLNMNVSVSNVNMILQAYASWNNLSQVHESYVRSEVVSPANSGSSIIDIHHKRDYYIIPQNKLGEDIFIRAATIRGLPRIIKMPSGDMKPLKVPVSKNMLDSHVRGNTGSKARTMVTFIIVDAQFRREEGLSSHLYAVVVRLSLDPGIPDGIMLSQQSARTSGSISEYPSSSELEYVKWNEVFFFKVESLDCYILELIMIDMGNGDPVGVFSAPLKLIAAQESSYSYAQGNRYNCIELSSPHSKNLPGVNHRKFYGRLRCAVLLSPRLEIEDYKPSLIGGRKTGFIQTSPTTEGPWTPVRLNYAAPAACLRFGNDVVASEVSVKDGSRYINIRSLVSVRNSTDFTLDLCLKPRALVESKTQLGDACTSGKIEVNGERMETDEFLETQIGNAEVGLLDSLKWPSKDNSVAGISNQEISEVKLPPGWEWIDDWHVDKTYVSNMDGWVYAPDHESLEWPESCDPVNLVNCVRQRRWIRNRKQISSDARRDISVGLLKPGDTIPLPLSSLTQSGLYFLYVRPKNVGMEDDYSWSTVVDKLVEIEISGKPQENSEICVSTLEQSEKLLYCAQNSGTSSDSSHGIWLCLSIQATEIAKDIHSIPIQDWTLSVKSPLSVTNYLPLTAEYSILEIQASGHFIVRSRGIFSSGKTVNIYCADITKPLFLSLLPQKGWLPTQEAVLISHPDGVPSKALSLRSSISGRIVQVIVEENNDKQGPFMFKAVRIYSPYWFAISRCPALTCRLVIRTEKGHAQKVALLFKSRKNDREIFEEITEEEFHEGYTIASALNFKLLGLSVSIGTSGTFGPIKDLSPLGDMDGSLDLYAYDAAGNCMRLFISSKPCPYQSIPTKVISIRPFMTFTNRIGKDIFIKLSIEDVPKILRASDSRVAFVFHETSELDKLQVRLQDTEWSFPVMITKEDTIVLVLRNEKGDRKFLRTEIRGYEEGSRFIVVFRLGSTVGPIRIENRTARKTVSFRQSGFGDDYWIKLEPLSTTNFSWEDPYGQKLLDIQVHNGSSITVSKVDLETTTLCSLEEVGVCFQMMAAGNLKVARFTDERISELNSPGVSKSLTPSGNLGISPIQRKTSNSVSPMELIFDLGVVGVSVIDHRPKELLYFYVERVYISYSTSSDEGTTSRFKLILGHLQLDNQLPLTLMPVLLAPEQRADMQHLVFKMTLKMQNENTDGIQVYPRVSLRVTDKLWRLNIHEPIIWALVDFYSYLQLDRLPQSSSAIQVDPEIRIELIDVSEIRLKVSLETAPAQRPRGVLGVWSPILSAVGNVFKIQVHLRKVMHRDRFMRKSSVIPAITNHIWRDLIHNPLHLIFSVDVLGMTSSTLASLSRGFAELSTDGQFLQLRSKQVWSRRITGVGDGIIQGTEALAQGVAFGVSGVVRKPVESAREKGVLGLAHGLGQAFVGFIVQPVSGALDFLSLTVDGVGASCARCFEVLSNRTMLQRVRNSRAIHSDGVLREYNEKESLGQMILYLAEASHHFGCAEIFKEPSKFAWSDYYENHFVVPQQRIVLVTNKRTMLLQCQSPNKMDKKPCKIMWDVPWEELLALELAKSKSPQPSLLILHLKTFKRSEAFARLIKCSSEQDPEDGEPQAVKICSAVRKMWKAYQWSMKSLVLKVPSSQRYVHFSWSEADGRDPRNQNKGIVMSRELSSSSSMSDSRRFVGHSMNFTKIWSSELESKSQRTLCQKKVMEDNNICSIWRPICPRGYASIGDIARIGGHPPNVATIYRNDGQHFARSVGFDLVWRNCLDNYKTPVSIWLPRPPEGFVTLGCVAVADFAEPDPNVAYCVAESLVEEAEFEAQDVWSAPNSYPWACHIYQVQSDALHFVALRRPKVEADWEPRKVVNKLESPSHPLEA